jgi:general L-amino acid transport system substrate-binding protein
MTTGGHRAFCVALALATLLLGVVSPAHADRGILEAVRNRGYVVCGVGDGPKGYSAVSPQGVWSGISVDFCRALAAGVVGTKDAVKFRLLSASEGFAALQSGEIDVLSRNIGMTSTRDTGLGVRFPGVLVYDGQGFMVRKSQNITSALELSGARICVTADGTDEQGITEYFAGLKMPMELMKFAKWSDAVMAYGNKSCMVLTADISTLTLARQDLPDSADQIILPETAARQPIGPAVRQGDEEWFSIVRWSLYALVAAEELGISSATLDNARSSPSGDVRRFLGIDADLGRPLGLSADWAQRIIRQIGNYGELFDRHLGQKSPLKLERRLNNLSTKGGLHYAPPFR